MCSVAVRVAWRMHDEFARIKYINTAIPIDYQYETRNDGFVKVKVMKAESRLMPCLILIRESRSLLVAGVLRAGCCPPTCVCSSVGSSVPLCGALLLLRG